MGYSEMNCPHCGKMNRESCNAHMYGSPIRMCKSCGKKYVDSRYTEPAISGFDTKSVNFSFFIKGVALFGAGFVFTLLWLIYSIKTRGRYSIRLAGTSFVCFLGLIMCIAMLIRIKSGIADSENQKFLEESEKRLSDKEYVRELIDNGIDVPEKYR